MLYHLWGTKYRIWTWAKMMDLRIELNNMSEWELPLFEHLRHAKILHLTVNGILSLDNFIDIQECGKWDWSVLDGTRLMKGCHVRGGSPWLPRSGLSGGSDQHHGELRRAGGCSGWWRKTAPSGSWPGWSICPILPSALASMLWIETPPRRQSPECKSAFPSGDAVRHTAQAVPRTYY